MLFRSLALYDSGEADTFLYYVMPFIEGESLRDLLDRETQLSVDDATTITESVAAALDYAHKQGAGIIHRDIKPANVMLDPEGVVVVMDFGISKALGATAGLTVDGSIIGTPEYMSPEQCRGNVLTGASDQYALGLLGYAMLTGAPPFSGPQWVVIASQIQDMPPTITEIRPDCPQDLVDSVHRMLAKVPGERWPSISEALRAFGGKHYELGDPIREATGRLVRQT